MRFSIKTIQRAGALATIFSGLSYIIIQLTHPANQFASLSDPMWQVAHSFNFAFTVLGMLAITAIYARQAEEAGWLGLISYVIFFFSLALMTGFAFYEAYVLPPLASEASDFINSSFAIFDGGAGPGTLGTWFNINGFLYLAGGALFGFSLLRSKVFSKASSIILIVGIAGSLLNAISEVLGRGSTIVVGISLIMFGIQLWRQEKNTN